MRYAELDGDTVTNVVVCDDPAYAQSQQWIAVDTLTPMPGVGWTRNPDGSFTPPPPPPPSSQEQARQHVAALTASIPDAITQATTDAAALAALTPGAPLTAEQTAALARHGQGWVDILAGLHALAVALGLD